MNHRTSFTLLCCWSLAVLSFGELHAQPAIPEPLVIFYGQITPATPAPDLTTVSFTLTGNSETLTMATPARVVTIEGTSWYIVSIPFETRAVSGSPALAATPNTLALTAANTTYTVTAKIGPASAILPAGKTTLIYGAPTQGLIDRIDLTLGGETYDEWSQRIFGSVVDPNGDEDQDGRSNRDEWLAGTDPEDPASRTFLTAFDPLPGGGFSLTFDTLEGRLYTIRRSLDLQDWQPIAEGIPGTGNPVTHTDTPGAEPTFFYRIEVSENP